MLHHIGGKRTPLQFLLDIIRYCQMFLTFITAFGLLGNITNDRVPIKRAFYFLIMWMFFLSATITQRSQNYHPDLGEHHEQCLFDALSSMITSLLPLFTSVIIWSYTRLNFQQYLLKFIIPSFADAPSGYVLCRRQFLIAFRSVSLPTITVTQHNTI